MSLSSRAGSFSSDFSSAPANATTYGNAQVDTTSPALKLTTAAAGFNQSGSFVINDLDPGQRVNGFTATFYLRMGGGTTPPGDGICFVFGTDVPNAAFDEDGSGGAGTISGLVVTFDAYDNSLGDNTEGPEFRIKIQGNLAASRKISNQFQTGAGYVPVTISYSTSGTLTLVYNNAVMFTNVVTLGPFATGARFGFGSRCGGGANQDQFIQNLNITTTTVSRFYVKGSAQPFPSIGIASNATFQVQLNDSGASVDPTTVTMSFKGAAVTPAASKNGAVTTIGYTPPALLAGNSTNRMIISFGYSNDASIDSLLYDFTVAATPLWSLAPNSRVYLPPDTDLSGGTTPLYRSLALSPHTNHLYIVSRTNNASGFGISVNVLDSTSGADLYRMSTNGIQSGGTITLTCVTVAEDGAIYACNVTTTNGVIIYKWANDSSTTDPQIVYNAANPGSPSNSRWGDALWSRGAGPATQLLLDSFFHTNILVLSATDAYATNFTAAPYTNAYTGGTSGLAIGRSIQFGPTNTWFVKKRTSSGTAPPVPAKPLQFVGYTTGPNTTTSLLSDSDYYGQVGGLTVDLSRNLAAGILFVTNTTIPDRLQVYDISNLASPLQIAQYNFPVNHLKNNNMIGQVIFGQTMIYAVDGNNGVIAVPVSPPPPTVLNIARSGSSAVLSWNNLNPAFFPQSSPTARPFSWTVLNQPISVSGNTNIVTDALTGTNKFYRLLK
ncbi:MAG: hypothetical protein C5B50_22870 [Verrucomicrobia bacterium]|nr:MAG: hypothetical protein C5B50_22870 [Verrucomicrobiota bacterium]